MAPRVVVRALDRVGEGVPVVENLPQAPLGQVGRDDPRLDGDRARRDLGQLLAGGIEEYVSVSLLHDAQDDRIGDETALDDFGGPGGEVLARQRGQQAHVGDDGAGRVERTDEILAYRRVDAGLAADGRVDHAEQRGRNVDETHASQPGGGYETRHVGGRSPAHGDDRVLAAQLQAPARVPQAGHDVDGLACLGVGVVGSGGLVPEAAQMLGQGLRAGGERAGVDDEGLGRRRVERGDDRIETEIASDGDGRRLDAGHLDGGAHECSRWVRMSVTTPSAGPGPLGTVSVATAR